MVNRSKAKSPRAGKAPVPKTTQAQDDAFDAIELALNDTKCRLSCAAETLLAKPDSEYSARATSVALNCVEELTVLEDQLEQYRMDFMRQEAKPS